MAKKKIGKINIKDAESYVQIYKAGFIDGYVQGTPNNKTISWDKIWKKCAQMFEKRFKVQTFMKGGNEDGNKKQRTGSDRKTGSSK